MITINVHNGMTIPLGREGENLARKIIFDVSSWQAEYGDGKVSLVANKDGAEPYPCDITVDGSIVTWMITASDTAQSGLGRCELHYIVGDTLVKSDMWRTYTADALGTPAPEPPEPQKAWVDKVLAAGQAAVDAAVNPPRIGDNGNWYVWDFDAGAYVDTGVAASGGGGVAGADYAQNDPEGPGYIANRPCYFTGNILEETIIDNLAVAFAFGEMYTYPGSPMVAGETYRLTINGISIDLVAYNVIYNGIPATAIGDDFQAFYAAMSGQGEFTPVYGWVLGTASVGGEAYASLSPTDSTGAMLAEAFGLTAEQMAGGTITITLTKLTPRQYNWTNGFFRTASGTIMLF